MALDPGRSPGGLRGSTPPQLPSLDYSSYSSYSNLGNSFNGSLRGSNLSRIPDIADRPLNKLLPEMKDGSAHPAPYFMTQNVVLKVTLVQPPPWLAAHKQSDRILLDFWRNNARFQDIFVGDFIRDSIEAEITAIVTGQRTEIQTRDNQDSRILAWLDPAVVAEEVQLLSEELVWEALWDEARYISKEDMIDLDSNYRKDKPDSQMMRILRDNYTHPIRPTDGKPLLRKDWGELLYQLNRLMQRGSLVENYAIKRLQEQIITQVAAKVVLDDALKFMEDEMANMDDDERTENPPRRG